MSHDAATPLVLIPGEINLDIIMSRFDRFPALGQEVLVDDLLVTLGSASAITAVGLSKLGTAVRFVGVVGADDWGDRCLESLRAAGVDVTSIRRLDSLRTGVTVSISSVEDRALVTFPGAIASLTADAVSEATWRNVSHLHVSSFFLQRALQSSVSDLFRAARARGATVSLDSGGDPADRWDSGVREAIATADLFLPNEVELRGISRIGDPAKALAALGDGRLDEAGHTRTTTVVKRGAQGCMALDRGQVITVPTPDAQATVVDTTGAGDSFNAGFLAAWLRRAALVECMRDGVCCGSLATRQLGGTTAQPTAEELNAYRRRHFRTGEIG